MLYETFVDLTVSYATSWVGHVFVHVVLGRETFYVPNITYSYGFMVEYKKYETFVTEKGND